MTIFTSFGRKISTAVREISTLGMQKSFLQAEISADLRIICFGKAREKKGLGIR